MPELPEVETIRSGLSALLPGHVIENVTVTYPKIFRGLASDIRNASITGIRRFAKVLAIDLDNTYSLLVHVKMTGQLIYRGPNLKGASLSAKAQEPGGKHTHVIFHLDRAGILYFNDTRKFGWIEVVRTGDIPTFGFIKRLGPEPLKDLTLPVFRKILQRSKAPVKVLLMNQEKIGGVGNIYANDALWLAKIHPGRPADRVSAVEQEKLYKAVLSVLAAGIAAGGASETSYVHPDGSEGGYQKHFLVYGKDGQSCSRCTAKIQKISLGGRGTYFCPVCQKQ